MHGRFLAAAVVAACAATACVDDESGPVTPGPGDGQFVGYADVSTKTTTCGNCHITKQRQWEATAHADAWNTLQASGHAQPFCAACHTVNGTSNQAPDSTGYYAVDDASKPRYHDVQCESCHGPGGPHVTAPDDTQPLTTIAADTGLAIGCGTCHSGVHHPFVAEWRGSRHGRVNASPNGRAECADCHNGTAWLSRVDRDAHFLEQDSTAWTPVVCSTCHDPHGGTGNPAQLRLPIDDASVENNLCMTCHHKRSVPETSNRGPHSPQGPMLVGEAGWRPSTFTYDSLLAVSSHGTATNSRLCAACHVNSFSVTDSTGTEIFTTGHTFRAIPCTDASGAIDTTDTCAPAQRTFAACAASGCHATENAARTVYATVQSRFANTYIRPLWVDVDGDGRIDAFPADSGMLATIMATSPGEFTANNTITAAEGTWFNVQLMLMPGNDVHNPFYGEALMIASTDELRRVYGLPVPRYLAATMRRRAAALGMPQIR